MCLSFSLLEMMEGGDREPKICGIERGDFWNLGSGVLEQSEAF
jgi:hypothetical protein